MSGTVKVKPPKNNQEWARNQQRRTEQLENPTATRMGDWVLSTQPGTGNLQASHVDGGSVVLAGKPEPSADADTVVGAGFPCLKVERVATQVENAGSSHPVDWDTLAHASPEFNFFPPRSEIVIPSNGVWMITLNLCFLGNSLLISKAIIDIDGIVVRAEENREVDAGGGYATFSIVDLFPLTAGSIVRARAYRQGGGTFGFGTTTADPNARSSMSLTRLPVG